MKRTLTILVSVGLVAGGLSSCSLAGAEDDDKVIVIGYQSRTINTVTAGTLLRDLGYFEDRLEEVDPDLEVEWQDYDTGAPITAQMLAGKIDIGSMGDYPLLINGSRAGTGDDGESPAQPGAGCSSRPGAPVDGNVDGGHAQPPTTVIRGRRGGWRAARPGGRRRPGRAAQPRSRR